jgi:hypothetical protein
MRIEEGEYYRAANGEKVGPMMATGGVFVREFGDGFSWNPDGTCYVAGSEEPEGWNLISEWTDSPIRTETVTTRRLEPGVYGPLRVGVEVNIPDCDRPDEPPQREVEAHLTRSALNASEWRELARVALEIAEYLDAQ